MIMNSFKWNTELDSISVDHQEDVISTVFFYWTKKWIFPYCKYGANIEQMPHLLIFAHICREANTTFASHLLS